MNSHIKPITDKGRGEKRYTKRGLPGTKQGISPPGAMILLNKV